MSLTKTIANAYKVFLGDNQYTVTYTLRATSATGSHMDCQQTGTFIDGFDNDETMLLYIKESIKIEEKYSDNLTFSFIGYLAK